MGETRTYARETFWAEANAVSFLYSLNAVPRWTHENEIVNIARSLNIEID